MQLKVDFNRLRERVRVEDVLAHYHVELRLSGTQLSAECPLPTHTSKDSKQSFKLNTEKNVWCCMSASCVEGYLPFIKKKGGGIIDLVMVMEHLPLIMAAKKLLDWFPENGEAENIKAPPEIDGAIGGMHCVDSERANHIIKPLGFELKGITYHPYLESRGISEETAKRFGIGFFPGKGSMSGRIVIPIRNEKGELVAYCGRALGNEEPRYKLPSGFQKVQKVLFQSQRT